MTTRADVRSFNLAIDRFIETDIPEARLEFKKLIATEALRSIVMKNPVKTGRSRGNWNVTRTAPSRAVNVNQFDKEGSATIERGMAKIDKSKDGEDIFVTNNVEYINLLEDGSSQQAREGMVRKTIEEIDLHYARP